MADRRTKPKPMIEVFFPSPNPMIEEYQPKVGLVYRGWRCLQNIKHNKAGTKRSAREWAIPSLEQVQYVVINQFTCRASTLPSTVDPTKVTTKIFSLEIVSSSTATPPCPIGSSPSSAA